MAEAAAIAKVATDMARPARAGPAPGSGRDEGGRREGGGGGAGRWRAHRGTYAASRPFSRRYFKVQGAPRGAVRGDRARAQGAVVDGHLVEVAAAEQAGPGARHEVQRPRWRSSRRRCRSRPWCRPPAAVDVRHDLGGRRRAGVEHERVVVPLRRRSAARSRRCCESRRCRCRRRTRRSRRWGRSGSRRCSLKLWVSSMASSSSSTKPSHLSQNSTVTALVAERFTGPGRSR